MYVYVCVYLFVFLFGYKFMDSLYIKAEASLGSDSLSEFSAFPKVLLSWSLEVIF